MSKQWQLRRGTKAENDIFTGAEGEVTLCTDTKGLRVHDGTTQGGFEIDTVVAFQIPTAANNYTWYRKYASGWVEQGGYGDLGGVQSSPTATIVFPLSMANVYYGINISCIRGDSGNFKMAQGVQTNTTTGMTFGFYASSDGCRYYTWEVKGMAA